jgi:diketogulonate reductase-like aldo/keto reductase
MQRLAYKKLQNGFSLPVYGLGTWQMGGRAERDLSNDDQRDIIAIQESVNTGVCYIDTAESYANGYSETLIGKAILGHKRSNLLISSKVKEENLKFNDVITACKRSLNRLQTDYLDLYLIHKYNPNINLQETCQALDFLISEGLVKNIGVSNFSKELLDKTQNLTKNKIVYNQVHYNLEYREPETNNLLEYCTKNDILLCAYRPVGKGNLLINVPTIVQEMCGKYNKTPAQIAINWLISQLNVITLAKTSNITHLKENLGALDWAIEVADIERLREEYPNKRDISDVVHLA